MQDQCGRFFSGQKLKLKNLLPSKNKLLDVPKNILPSNFNLIILVSIFSSLVMPSKLDINNFGNFEVSSILDTGILHRAHAATGTTTTMKLKDLPIGGVINLGAYNYVKIADNQFMQTEVAACPDGKTVAGKYVKCFEDSSAYTQTCTGSYYCNTSNTAWNSSTGKCDSSVTCPVGSAYCGDNSSWDSTSSKCVGSAGSNSCGSGTTWDSASKTCVIAVMQNWTGCSNLVTNATIDLYDITGGKTYTVKKFADGNCYTYDNVSDSSTQTNAKTLCSNISGWSLPTKDQFDNLISVVESSNIPDVWCGGDCAIHNIRDAGRWWSATEYNATYAYFMGVTSTYAWVNRQDYGEKTYTYQVRCIKD